MYLDLLVLLPISCLIFLVFVVFVVFFKCGDHVLLGPVKTR